jgi:FixJ family two-component response regulator
VIVVDDDPWVREALENLLNSAQLRAAVFSSAEDVLESGLLERASCLISDLRMPGMHGLELQRRVQREYPKLPILLITGHREDQMAQAALSEGGARLFYKPLDPEDFLNAIHAAVSESPKDS